MRTLLSQLPTARKSATGEKEIAEMESGGGSETSTSFGSLAPAVAAVELDPKNDMANETERRVAACASSLRRTVTGSARRHGVTTN